MNIKSNQEYEIISHNSANFKVFVVNLLYRTPHSHKDFEVGLVLEGEVELITATSKVLLQKDDIFLLNPYQSHELLAPSPALILSIQIPPKYFEIYYPKISCINFVPIHIKSDTLTNNRLVRSFIFDIAKEFFKKEEYYEFRCANLINQLFYYFLKNVEHIIYTEQELKAASVKGQRARRIMHYIDDHYNEKILLSDLATAEGLDLYYLSHFFKENFGVTFHEYVNKLRCEHARHLLLVSDYSLLDICINSGFSDAKYFNKHFTNLYGCAPKQYRKNFENQDLSNQQKSMLSTQNFLSVEASILTLKL